MILPFSTNASSNDDPPISQTTPVAFGQLNKTPEAANIPSSLPVIILILILKFFSSFFMNSFPFVASLTAEVATKKVSNISIVFITALNRCIAL